MGRKRLGHDFSAEQDNRMHFPALMQRLGVELSVPGLTPDATGACAIALDDLKVSFFAGDAADRDDAFMALCKIGALDPDDQDTLEILLRGNMVSVSAGGSAIAMGGDGEVYISQRFQSQQLSFPQFFSSLERFANVAEYWRDNLATGEMPVLAT